MDKPLLSICIPTFSRSNYLKECLIALVLQLDQNPKLLEKVEIVISDNASPDNTKEVVESFQEKYKNIKYFCNVENLGSDENYINSVSKAEGLYSWLIGDDDFIMNDVIDFVVNFLELNRVLILSVGFKSFVNFEEIYKKNKLTMDMVSFFTSHNTFFFQGYCVGILCANIFDRLAWLNTDRTNYNKGWSYYEIALKMIATNSSLPMAHLFFPAVVVREDCAWVEHGTELFTFINSNIVTEKMKNFGFDKQRLEKDLTKNSKRILIILLRAKGHGLKCNMKNLKYIYGNLKQAGFWRLFVATLIYFVPNKIIMATRNFKKVIINKIR